MNSIGRVGRVGADELKFLKSEGWSDSKIREYFGGAMTDNPPLARVSRRSRSELTAVEKMYKERIPMRSDRIEPKRYYRFRDYDPTATYGGYLLYEFEGKIYRCWIPDTEARKLGIAGGASESAIMQETAKQMKEHPQLSFKEAQLIAAQHLGQVNNPKGIPIGTQILYHSSARENPEMWDSERGIPVRGSRDRCEFKDVCPISGKEFCDYRSYWCDYAQEYWDTLQRRLAQHLGQVNNPPRSRVVVGDTIELNQSALGFRAGSVAKVLAIQDGKVLVEFDKARTTLAPAPLSGRHEYVQSVSESFVNTIFDIVGRAQSPRSPQSPELPKLPKSRTAAELNKPGYIMQTDFRDIVAVCDYIGIDCDTAGITGAIVSVDDGGYDEIWLTESSRPYDLNAVYYTPEYFKSTNIIICEGCGEVPAEYDLTVDVGGEPVHKMYCGACEMIAEQIEPDSGKYIVGKVKLVKFTQSNPMEYSYVVCGGSGVHKPCGKVVRRKFGGGPPLPCGGNPIWLMIREGETIRQAAERATNKFIEDWYGPHRPEHVVRRWNPESSDNPANPWTTLTAVRSDIEAEELLSALKSQSIPTKYHFRRFRDPWKDLLRGPRRIILVLKNDWSRARDIFTSFIDKWEARRRVESDEFFAKHPDLRADVDKWAEGWTKKRTDALTREDNVINPNDVAEVSWFRGVAEYIASLVYFGDKAILPLVRHIISNEKGEEIGVIYTQSIGELPTLTEGSPHYLRITKETGTKHIIKRDRYGRIIEEHDEPVHTVVYQKIIYSRTSKRDFIDAVERGLHVLRGE